jgi:glycosyltransferase involved in cell wall biosynthesis
MKVAYYSPLPPERSGIADYSALLLPSLRRRVEVELPKRRSTKPLRGTDAALYHIGNSADAHAWIVEALRQRPGLVVLHDFVLHHLVAGMTLGRGDREGYLDAMQRDSGVIGRLLAHGVIDGLIPPLWETRPQDFPLAHAVLGSAGGLVVHSRWVEERVRDLGYESPIWRIPHPAWPQRAPDPDPELKSRRSPVVGCFGNLTPSKRIGALVDAFARVRSTCPEALLLMVGSPSGVDIRATLERAGLSLRDEVVLRDHVDEARLWSLAAACDVCVSLRWPTMGEASGIAIRMMGLGKPLVVTDAGWFSELPDDVALKVTIGGDEVPDLAAILERLISDPELRHRMGIAGQSLVESEHDVERVADLYAEAIETYAGSGAMVESVLNEVARAAWGIGLDADARELTEVAAALREVGIAH